MRRRTALAAVLADRADGAETFGAFRSVAVANARLPLPSASPGPRAPN
jgi:hypothetical protein